ncbi:P-loop containing nucleoside triphosphate hydrolase protein [Neurospora tetraspora]|uniref:P-loop containing nucleoside triphosphate hydrolase protein n=1 Tax=Neurospora tetraspora TaxID=94610 RepID=A0AAE0JHT3_9PEZI|nr:P-loop containing nucleoside triphosphate hydrolase protein [Neurospora tetraspora]
MPSQKPRSHGHSASTGSAKTAGTAGVSSPTQGTRQSQQPPVPISITICGDGGCGKSSITLRLVRSQWTEDYDPTIEDSYSITRRIDGVTYHLSLTDTAGQEEYRGMWASSNLGADAFLMVYDITSRDSLDALQYFNDLIDMEAETRADNAARARRAGLSPAQISGSMSNRYATGSNMGGGAGSGAKAIPPVKIVAGNKCDLSEKRVVTSATGLEWARARGCGFMETSARLEVNIEETFALIVRRVVEQRRLAELGITGVDQEAAEELLGSSRGRTKPLSPLPTKGGKEGGLDEKDGGSGRRKGKRGGASRFLKSLKFWCR